MYHEFANLGSSENTVHLLSFFFSYYHPLSIPLIQNTIWDTNILVTILVLFIIHFATVSTVNTVCIYKNIKYSKFISLQNGQNTDDSIKKQLHKQGNYQ